MNTSTAQSPTCWEQARKANIGLLAAHQSLSQAGGAKGNSGITDALMVNTATKIIWTTFREDAAKFAGSTQIKPEDIQNLPEFTFGMHSRKRGFTPIRGVHDALKDFPRREDRSELRETMAARYGPLPVADVPEVDQEAPDEEPQGDDPVVGSRDEGPGEPPDVEMI